VVEIIHQEVKAIPLNSTATSTRVVKGVTSIPEEVEEVIMVAVVGAIDMDTMVVDIMEAVPIHDLVVEAAHPI